jgi:diacylglycerol kinase
VKRFIESLGHALAGLGLVFKSERNFRIQVVVAVLAVAAGIYLGLNTTEWVMIIISIGSVICAELFNTALERLSDEVADGRQRPLIKKAKDLSAGSVLLAALTALVIGLLVLLIPIIRRLLS